MSNTGKLSKLVLSEERDCDENVIIEIQRGRNNMEVC